MTKDMYCIWHFRFQKQDMTHLLAALEIPEYYTGYQGSHIQELKL